IYGAPLVVRNSKLLARLGHVVNQVVLPNGQIINVDMTPYADTRTPKADLKALEFPSQQDSSDYWVITFICAYDVGCRQSV
ncbi:MAG: hypothetical protein M3P33_02150, partial [bacterium]|nr:hypothetical protein [bacterium]